jgi:NitT/TauT family transport system ATP-binding protein
MLRSANNHRLEWDVVRSALELEFHPEEAERQLNTIIEWGRYAEILAYDKNDKILYLEPSPTAEIVSR